MGVYKLNVFLRTIKGPGAVTRLKYLPKIDHYFIDVNGILHPVAQQVFAYHQGTFDDAKEERDYYRRVALVDGKDWKEDLMPIYYAELTREFESYLQTIQPEQTFALCVDGIAPGAKIFQQRSRRLGGSSNVSAEAEATLPKAQTGFTSNMITPGTEFMELVHQHILIWLVEMKKKYPRIKFIYSSYLIPGEGEHKIFQLIRDLQIGNKKDIFAIEGIDGDLISLTILRQEHFYLIRSSRGNFIDMNGFKQYVWSNMMAGKKFNRELVIQDFVLLLYMIGNDFLPRFLFVEEVGPAILEMMNCYRTSTKTPLTTTGSTIDWNSMAEYMSCLTQLEKSLLIKKSNTVYFYEHPILHSSEAIQLSRQNEDKYFEYVREEYYKSIILPKDPIGKALLRDLDMNSEIVRICSDICQGMQWVLRYYTGQPFDLAYSYGRESAPFIADIWRYIMIYLGRSDFAGGQGSNSQKEFNIISQLMSVIPLKNNDLVPPPFNQEVLPGGPFNYLFPIGFPVKREGILVEKDVFMQKAVLPLVNGPEMIDFVNSRVDLWPGDVAKLIEKEHQVVIL